MAVNYYASVWPVPGTTPWVPRLDSLDWAVLSATKRNGLGSGSFQIPVGSDQLNQILYKDPDNPANDIESLIRVYRVDDNTVGPALDYEFFADNAPNLLAEQGVLQFSGGGIETELDKLRVLPFDYPRRPTLDQHWLFGSDRNAVRNGGFEDNPLAITNPGFEDGTVGPWWAGAVEGVNANVQIITGANVDTGTFAAEIDPLTAEGGISTSIRVLPDTEYTVTARFKAGAGVDYQLGASGPDSIVPLGGAVFATAFGDGYYGPGQKHEAQTRFVSTGAYQTVTLTFRTGPSQTSTQISMREGEAVLNGQLFYLDVVTVSGNGIGISPWQSSGVTTFQASSAQFDTGAWSGHIVGAVPGAGASSGGYVFQRINGFIPGATYTASSRVRSPVASRLWALEVRDVTGNLLAQTSASLAANTWTSLSVTFMVPLFLPGPDRALEFRIVNYSGVSADLFLDTNFLIQGQPATTVGEIMQQLMDDVNVNHVAETPPFDVPGKPWITYSTFTASLDSNGNAWTDSEISITIREGTRYSDVLNGFVRMGYEWELTPDPVTDGEWELKIYNPGGKGSVLPDEIGLVAGASDIGGPVARSRIPSNWLFTRGSGGVFDVTQSAASLSSSQFQMGYSQALDIDDEATAALRGAAQMADNIDAGISLQMELAPTEDDHLIPGRDFTVGDALAVTVPGVIVRGVRRCEAHTVTLKSEPGDESPLTFVVSFLSENYASGGGGVSTGSPDNRIARGLELVMRKLERTEDPAETQVAPIIVTGGVGGAPTIVIAASDSSAFSKARADYICTGVNDHVVFNQAITALRAIPTTPNSGPGARILATEGTFIPAGNISIDRRITLEGMNPDATVFRIDSNFSSSIFSLDSGCRLKHLSVQKLSSVTLGATTPRGVSIVGGDSIVEDCRFIQAGGAATTGTVHASNGLVNVQVIDCEFDQSREVGICFQSIENGVISGNRFRANTGDGILYLGVCEHTRILNNQFDACQGNGIGLGGSGHEQLIIANNVINEVESDGISMGGNSSTYIIKGNTIVLPVRYGMWLLGTQNGVIADNVIEEAGDHGIYFADSDNNQVHDNNIIRPGFNGAGHDGIFVADDSDENEIHHNTIVPDIGVTRNGINIDTADCDCNKVVGNVLGDPADYTGDAIVDNGTLTQLFYPNDPTYGDNFTLCAGSS